jgi:hypothetical protein
MHFPPLLFSVSGILDAVVRVTHHYRTRNANRNASLLVSHVCVLNLQRIPFLENVWF